MKLNGQKFIYEYMKDSFKKMKMKELDTYNYKNYQIKVNDTQIQCILIKCNRLNIYIYYI